MVCSGAAPAAVARVRASVRARARASPRPEPAGIRGGLVDVRRTMARFAEKELGLPPEALTTVFDTVGTTDAAAEDRPY